VGNDRDLFPITPEVGDKRGQVRSHPFSVAQDGAQRGTRISCFATMDGAACAAFIKESRMELASATNINRKSGRGGTVA
jgi:hypothetical protein